jgi:hypothetical protein
MKLISPPDLTVIPGTVSDTDSRPAIHFVVQYSYSCTVDEIKFIEDNSLVILETVTIVGVNPTAPGSDIDLRFGIRPQFNVRPPKLTDADELKSSGTLNRKYQLYVLEKDLLAALDVDDLNIGSVKAKVQLIYTHMGESRAEKAR